MLYVNIMHLEFLWYKHIQYNSHPVLGIVRRWVYMRSLPVIYQLFMEQVCCERIAAMPYK